MALRLDKLFYLGPLLIRISLQAAEAESTMI
jgi:hypothetical protein